MNTVGKCRKCGCTEERACLLVVLANPVDPQTWRPAAAVHADPVALPPVAESRPCRWVDKEQSRCSFCFADGVDGTYFEIGPQQMVPVVFGPDGRPRR